MKKDKGKGIKSRLFNREEAKNKIERKIGA